MEENRIPSKENSRPSFSALLHRIAQRVRDLSGRNRFEWRIYGPVNDPHSTEMPTGQSPAFKHEETSQDIF